MIDKITKKIKEDEEIKKILTQEELEKLENILKSSESEKNKKLLVEYILNGDNKWKFYHWK